MNLAELKEKFPLPFELLDTQEEDINQLLLLDKALIDLPVGYGKTVIATYTALGHECDRILVTLPPILITQWTRWIQSIPNIGSAIGYCGAVTKRKEIALDKYRWIFVSYGILKNDFKQLAAWLSTGRKGGVIVDEAHALKNSSSKLFEEIRELSLIHNTWLMTGTPSSNPLDNYSYIKIKTPSIYRNYAQFERIHVEKIDSFMNPSGFINLDLMSDNLRINCVYRDKADVHKHLKARTYPIYYQLSDLTLDKAISRLPIIFS